MSAKSKSSDAKAPDRPFDKAVLAKARQIAQQYQIVLKTEDGEWFGHGLELPGAPGDGKTPAAAVADTREALVTMVAYMLEEGQAIPSPASEGNRSVQATSASRPRRRPSWNRARGHGVFAVCRTSSEPPSWRRSD